MAYPLNSKGLIIVLLIAAITAIYYQVAGFSFLTWDDNLYVTQNLRVQEGLTGQNVLWAFTTLSISNWHPLTWLAHMLDIELFGMNSGSHHLTNVLLHLLNTLLLFTFLSRYTGSQWRSGLVAALFALHPLHVESVAWIAERKDMLSALFLFMTLHCYAWYQVKPGTARYVLLTFVFCLGLMSKPMLVTLPILLMLVDIWPLKRTDQPVQPCSYTAHSGSIASSFLNKLPLFILSALSALITVYAQQRGGTIATIEVLPVQERVSNALLSYLLYLFNTLWPVDLHIHYPFNRNIPLWQAVAAAGCIALISWMALKSIRKNPWLAVGWLWYLITLLPVIGLIQVGVQSMADRYTYIPLVGVFIMIAWIDTALPVRMTGLLMRRTWSALLLAALIAMTSVSWRQIGHWRDDIALYRHSLQIQPDNKVVEMNLALALETELKINPDNPEANFLFGNSMRDLGMPDRAAYHYRRAFENGLHTEQLILALARTLISSGHAEEALSWYRKLPIDTADDAALLEAGLLAVRLQRFNDAQAWLKRYLARRDDAIARYNLGICLARTGRLEEAIHQYRQAINIDPRQMEARNNLGSALEQLGRVPEAIATYDEAIEIDPDKPLIHYNLAIAREKSGSKSGALASYRRALELDSSFYQARAQIERLEASQ